MDRFIPGFITVAMIVTGIAMLVCPAELAAKNRDDRDDISPASPAEVRRIRVCGIVLIAGGAYGLYAVLMNLPGAEFNGV